MIEEWAEIIGGDNAYASTLGRIKRNGSVIRQWRDPEGYMKAYVGGEVGLQRVHTLVLKAFSKSTPGRNYVNHKNGKKDDNRLKNLEWSTPRENSMYAALRGEWKQYHPPRRIKAVRISDGDTEFYRNQREAARALNIHNSEINKMLHGKRKTCHGYKFEYTEEVTARISNKNQIPGQMVLTLGGYDGK